MLIKWLEEQFSEHKIIQVMCWLPNSHFFNPIKDIYGLTWNNGFPLPHESLVCTVIEGPAIEQLAQDNSTYLLELYT